MNTNLNPGKWWFILFLFLLFSGCGKTKKAAILPDRGNGGITLPEKFGAVVWVDTLGRGRHLAVAENGDVYVHLIKLNHEGKGIVAMRDTNGDGRADTITGYSNVPGTGIEVHNDYLYYSDRTHVYRSKITPGELIPGQGLDTIVTMVDGGGHMEKTFTFDNKGNMYVNIGSQSNDCEEILRTAGSKGVDPCTELETRAGIWKFDDNLINQAQDLQHRYATGIRNAVALSWNFDVGRLFAVQHGRDDLHRYWPQYYSEEDNLELPSEIFFDLEQGDDMGWPYCYYDHLQGMKLLNPEYGGNGKAVDRCANAKSPLLGFPGHWAPNDLLFYKGNLFPEKYRQGAFIAFHGSWNRLGHDQQGFKVVFIPMKEGKPSGNWEVFADGFIGPAPVENPGDAYFRPCGLAEGPDGSLYICDSQHGRVWRILYYKDGIPGYVDRPLFQHEKTGAPIQTNEALKEGKTVYDAYCLQCHMANGKGAPGMNPPIVGTAIVKGDKTELIRIILKGFSQPTKIDGELYQNVMASHAFLSDKQIADVLTFVRNSWGNSYEPVKPDEVAKVRVLKK
jgi:glucose/arabinose dehydrogenase/mono/diheme cytochrome c family protein